MGLAIHYGSGGASVSADAPDDICKMEIKRDEITNLDDAFDSVSGMEIPLCPLRKRQKWAVNRVLFSGGVLRFGKFVFCVV